MPLPLPSLGHFHYTTLLPCLQVSFSDLLPCPSRHPTAAHCGPPPLPPHRAVGAIGATPPVHRPNAGCTMCTPTYLPRKEAVCRKPCGCQNAQVKRLPCAAPLGTAHKTERAHCPQYGTRIAQRHAPRHSLRWQAAHGFSCVFSIIPPCIARSTRKTHPHAATHRCAGRKCAIFNAHPALFPPASHPAMQLLYSDIWVPYISRRPSPQPAQHVSADGGTIIPF